MRALNKTPARNVAGFDASYRHTGYQGLPGFLPACRSRAASSHKINDFNQFSAWSGILLACSHRDEWKRSPSG
jgi:hypothetical protein